MKKRTLWGPIVAIAALYAIKIGLRLADDAQRYNRILALSDEGPLTSKLPGLAMQVISEERATVKEWLTFLMSFPGDIVRYFRMESM
jgi:hypothetical protein